MMMMMKEVVVGERIMEKKGRVAIERLVGEEEETLMKKFVDKRQNCWPAAREKLPH